MNIYSRVGVTLIWVILLGLHSLSPAFGASKVVAWGEEYSGVTNVPPDLTNVISVAAAQSHAFALKQDGTVVAWGRYYWGGTPIVPPGLTNVVAIAAGNYHGVALKQDGSVVNWSLWGEEQPVPPEVTNVVALAAGDGFSMALKSDGTVFTWGLGGGISAEILPPPLTNVVAIAAGIQHCLALTADGRVTAWGVNYCNQTNVPSNLTNAVSICAAVNQSLAIRADGTAVAWGCYEWDQGYRPFVPPDATNLVEVAGANGHTLALRGDGTVLAWSRLEWVGTRTSVPIGLSNVVAIASGSDSSLALVGDGAPVLSQPIDRVAVLGGTTFLTVHATGAWPLSYQWQHNGINIPGGTNNTLTLSGVQYSDAGPYSVVVSSPAGQTISWEQQLFVVAMMVTLYPKAQTITLGGDATFQIKALGTGTLTYQWQHENTDIPGATNATLRLRNVQLQNAGQYTITISDSSTNTFRLTTTLDVSNLAIWGNAEPLYSTLPVGLSDVIGVSVSSGHILALKRNGSVIAWGNNWAGQTNIPTGLSDVAAIAAGGSHSLALTKSGNVVAWGGDSVLTNLPTGLTNIVSIAAGDSHSLALRSDGTVLAWGQSYARQTSVPPGLSNVTAIAAGPNYSLALRLDGTVVGWGDNSSRQLSIPSDLTNAVAIAAGPNHCAALRANGTVVTWGTIQAGNPLFGPSTSSISNVVAIACGGTHRLALTDQGKIIAWGYDQSGGLLRQATNLAPAVALSASTWTLSAAILATGPLSVSAPVISGLSPAAGTVYLRVAAVGTYPLSYQWKLNGSDIPDATNAVLQLLNVTDANAGTYSVVVTDSQGSLTLSTATLSVVPFLVVDHPQSRSTYTGSQTSFGVTVAGQGPFTFQWRHNGESLTGETNSTLLLQDVTLDESGAYDVVVSNGSTSASSSPALLAVNTVSQWPEPVAPGYIVPLGLSNVVAVAAGAEHQLALNADGTVVAWGANWYGQTNVPADLHDAIAVAAGYYHSLALRSNGTVVAWGGSSGAETNIPAGLSDVVAIAAGAWNNLALKSDGTLVGWGNNAQLIPAGISNVTAIACTETHSIAVKADGTVVTWPPLFVGNGVLLRPPANLTNAIAVAAQNWADLALTSDRRVVVWGGAQVPATTGVSGLAAWSDRSVVLREDGSVLFSSSFPRIGVPITNAVAVALGGSGLVLHGFGPPVVSSPAVNRVVGFGSTTYLSATAVGERPLSYQWTFQGTNLPGATNAVLTLRNVDYRQGGVYAFTVSNRVGQTTSMDMFVTVKPVLVAVSPQPQTAFLGGMATFTAVAVGEGPFTYQWQRDGQNVPGATASTLVLTRVGRADIGVYSVLITSGQETVRSLPAGLSVQTIAAWGDYGSGQTNVPPGLSNVIALAGTDSGSFALLPDGTITNWGSTWGIPPGVSNIAAIAAGQNSLLGLMEDGTLTNLGGWTSYPIPPEANGIAALAAGPSHYLALTTNGTVIAWGDNSSGQTNVPPGLDNVVAIAAGGAHSLALKADGTVVGWGADYSRQATPPPTVSNIVAIACGYAYSVALRANGTLIGWGENSQGQIGPGLTNVIALAAAANNTVALRRDGTVAVVGDGSYRQRIVPAGLTNAVSVALGGRHVLALLGDGPPLLSTPLLDRTVAAGQTALFRASAIGAQPLNYQWRFNGIDLLDQTNTVLALTNAAFSDEGEYSVVVSNSVGVAVSGTVRLTVAPLLITSRPKSVSTFLSSSATFKVSAIGESPVFFQWSFEGSPILDATNSTFTITNLQWANAGSYSVVISNGFQVVQTEAALLLGQVATWGYGDQGQTNLPAGLSNIVAIAAGGAHSLALKGDGTVVAWGANWSGATNVPAGLENVTAIAAGNDRSLALKADGTVVSWGNVAPNPPNLSEIVAISAGSSHNLALKRDGRVVGWGWSGATAAAVPPGLVNVVAIAAGDSHSLALRANGTVAAWGENWASQISVPLSVTNVIAIAAGSSHSMALRADGTVVVWGDSSSGQRTIPPGTTNVVAIAAGSAHSLALKADGTVVAWGSLPPGAFARTLGGVSAIEGGGSHSLALIGQGAPVLTEPLLDRTFASGTTANLRANAIGVGPLSYQWRLNGTNLAGATSAVLSLSDVQPSQAGAYSVIVSNIFGQVTSSDLTLDVENLLFTRQPTDQSAFLGGTAVFRAAVEGNGPPAYQWQFNGTVLADATNSTLTLTNIQLSQVGLYAVTASNSLGTLKSQDAYLAVGRVAVWGSSYPAVTNVPPGLTNVIAVSAGEAHCLALRADGTVVSWGEGYYSGATNVPAGLDDVIAIGAGPQSSFALRRDGSVWAWGAVSGDFPDVLRFAPFGNNAIALNLDGTVNTLLPGYPTPPGDLENIVGVAGGSYHFLALQYDGAVRAWGDNTYNKATIPAGVSNVIAIAAGQDHNMVLLSSGRIRSWGYNGSQQVTVPTAATNVVDITAAGYNSLALREDGTVLVWGDNSQRQRAVPAGLKNVIAADVGNSGVIMALIGDAPPLESARIRNIHWDADNFTFSLPTQSGKIYSIEVIDSLDIGTWTASPLFPGDGSEMFFEDPNPPADQKFYRVRRW